MITKKQAKQLPSTFGVYIFKKNKEVLYVGKSVNIKSRVISHIENAKLDRKEFLIISQSTKLDYILTENEFRALLLETELIKKYTPKYNVRWRDNKSYLYIKISVNDEYPKVTTCRLERNKKSLYFGPFSSQRQVRDLVSDIRHIIPFCTQERISRNGCFYSKLHLCEPCPNKISMLTDKALQEEKKILYKNNIRKVIRILKGSVKMLLIEFNRSMKSYVRKNNFEEALKIRNKIYRLDRLIHYPLAASSHNLDIKDNGNDVLRKILISYFPGLVKLDRIETYDISNLGLKNQTASMVVALNGQIDKSQYRRFKIKTEGLRSDFERLSEVVLRRLDKKWPKPDLMVVDGGEPQVDAIRKILISKNNNIPLIGIAKNPDRLVIGIDKFPTIKPAQNNAGFNLVRHLRDESHRFAKKYHLYLRERDFLL